MSVVLRNASYLHMLFLGMASHCLLTDNRSAYHNHDGYSKKIVLLDALGRVTFMYVHNNSLHAVHCPGSYERRHHRWRGLNELLALLCKQIYYTSFGSPNSAAFGHSSRCMGASSPPIVAAANENPLGFVATMSSAAASINMSTRESRTADIVAFSSR